ncbi:LacI family DNA-binding transcriptional regulator [Saccharopolyspora shandongensis]|uniref:LacI family DNA-binding transcriptional regulator n=1 Tax=Saccharopolyspora shandongensis TaxID=418495 RepID=UPI0033DD838E
MGQRPRTVGIPTMRDVATMAGVSTMTVSRVLRDEPRVAAEVRTRVLDAVQRLGYRRNENARGLRLGNKTGLIGLIVTNLANPFYAQLALGIEATAAEHDLHVVLGNTGENATRERELVEKLAGRQVDGLIVVPAGYEHSHLSADSLHDVPVVLAARPPIGIAADCVLVDDFTGAHAATAQLVANGHRRIAFLGNPPSVYTGVERYHGFCVALDQAGIPLDERYVRRAQQDIQAAERAALDVLCLDNPPTALFCTNNRNTIGAVRAIKRLDTPTAIAAFDDFELADVLDVPLTIVSYDAAELGRQALKLLLDRMTRRDDLPRRAVIPTSLITHGDLTCGRGAALPGLGDRSLGG